LIRPLDDSSIRTRPPPKADAGECELLGSAANACCSSAVGRRRWFDPPCIRRLEYMFGPPMSCSPSGVTISEWMAARHMRAVPPGEMRSALCGEV